MSNRCPEAQALETRPDVIAWVRRLRRLARDIPDGVRVYTTNCTLVVTDDCIDAGEDSLSIAHHAVESIAANRWQGGDW